MVDTNGIVGWQASVEVGDGGTPEIFTEIPEVNSFEPADPQYDEAEFTHLRVQSRRKVFKPTFADGGEVNVEMNTLLQDPVQANLRTLRDSGAIRNWKLIWRTNETVPSVLATCMVPGYVKSFKPGAAKTTDPVTSTLVIRVTGGEAWS